MLTRRIFLAAPAAVAASAARTVPPPAAFGATPTERQIRWHELETAAFLHFTVNTFTGQEWGYGDEDPNIFQPAAFDADAIAGTLAGAGVRGVILTCKHHDGFCLWPTRTTEHSVRSSSWRSGHGDVVRDISDAARSSRSGTTAPMAEMDSTAARARNGPSTRTPTTTGPGRGTWCALCNRTPSS
jgi:alpha-L-fucosidase